MNAWSLKTFVVWIVLGGHSIPSQRANQRTSPSPRTTRTQPVLRLGPMLFHVKQGKVKRVEQLDLKELYQVSAKLYQQKKYRTAIQLYKRILKYFPKSTYRYAALYNLGLAYENSKQYTKAIKTYRSFIQKHPKQKADVRHARFRMASCYEERKEWQQAFQIYDVLLQKDLSTDDRIDALAAAGRAMFKQKRYAQARPLLRLAVVLHTRRQKPKKPIISEAAAMAQYYRGRSLDLRFRRRKFNLPVAQLKKDLDYKAGHLLKAQHQYFATVRLRHSDWALAAVYRIGEMYEKMYLDMMKAPYPKDLKPMEIRIYREELRKRVKILLDKALVAYRHNLQLAQRIGIANNRWQTLTQQRFQALLDFYVKNFGKPPFALPTSRPAPSTRPTKAPSSRPTSQPAQQ